MKRKGKVKQALQQAAEDANLRHELAGVRMRSSDLPPPRKRRSIMTVRAFLDALFEARAVADEGGASGSAIGLGGGFGAQLERARILVGRQHSLDGEMAVHDDCRIAASARVGGAPSLNSFSGTLERIWSSLEAVERRVLSLGRGPHGDDGIGYDQIAEVLVEDGIRTKAGAPTVSFVNQVVSSANGKIQEALKAWGKQVNAMAAAAMERDEDSVTRVDCGDFGLVKV